MAVPSSILALDIGSHTVKLGEFSLLKDGGIALHRFSAIPLGLDPNKEEDRHSAVTRAVRTALTAAGVRGGRAAFSVAGHAVFMRGVKLPPVDAMQLDQMIAFEAQQIVPFPLAEVVWDFLVLPGTSIEKEAIIVAIKSDLLEAEYGAVKSAGVDPQQIDVGPLALYNAYRFNYAPVDHCVLLVDIGARSTNLLFIERDKLYTRILPLAGNTISQTICNEFQEPFAVAENLKIERGGVNLGGNYAQPDDRDTARLWKLVRTVAGRIQTEINRSIVFYRNQQGGSAPQQILLTGGSSRLPYLDAFLTEKFGVQVEYFNPLQNVSIQQGLDRAQLGREAHAFGEIVGLALRAAGPAPAEIKLPPPSVEARARASRQGPVVYAALAVWLLVFAVAALALWYQLQASHKTLETLNGHIEGLTSISAKISPLAKENDDLTAKFGHASRIIGQRDTWGDLLGYINSKVPQGVWITQLTPTHANGVSLDSTKPAPAGAGGNGGNGSNEIAQIQIKGMFEDGLQPEIINRFVSALVEDGDPSQQWFDLSKDKISNAIVSTDTPQPNSGQLAWNYTLSLKLKKPINLAP